MPSDIPVAKIGSDEHNLIDIIVRLGFAPSRTQARKLHEAGAVRLNDEKHPALTLEHHSFPAVLRVGKRQFCKLEI